MRLKINDNSNSMSAHEREKERWLTADHDRFLSVDRMRFHYIIFGTRDNMLGDYKPGGC